MSDFAAVDESDPAHITPQMFRAYLAHRRGVDVAEVCVPALVVGTFQRRVWQQLCDQTSAVSDARGVGRDAVERGNLGDRDLAIARFPVGAPAAVVLMEELIACGARQFLFISAAGSLQPTLPIGSLAIATSAIREEGTSLHYLPPNVVPRISPSLLNALEATAYVRGHALTQGPVWTTDAPYRELSSKVAHHAARGVLAVEMEAAALYAVGHYRSVEVAVVLVISDELFHPWRPGFHMDELQIGLNEAVEVVLDTAAIL